MIEFQFVSRSAFTNTPALSVFNNKPATGDKPLPEPMMTQFNDTYMRH